MKNIKILHHILAVIFSLTIACHMSAQTVGYTYKALAAEGCSMKYNVAKQDTSYCYGKF